MNDYENSAFHEVKAIIERRFARRLKFMRRFLIGLFLMILVGILGSLAFGQAYRNYADGWIIWEEYSQYRQMIEMVMVLGAAAVLSWAGWAWIEMLTGNAKDRALRREINEERQWRLRQWESGMVGDAPPPAYLLSDDGEIEETIYQGKRKRVES